MCNNENEQTNEMTVERPFPDIAIRSSALAYLTAGMSATILVIVVLTRFASLTMRELICACLPPGFCLCFQQASCEAIDMSG